MYAGLLFQHRHRIYPKQALRDGVSPERRLMDKKIAHTILLWEVRLVELSFGFYCSEASTYPPKQSVK